MLRTLVPNVETLGYYRMSLRDKGLDRFLGPSLGSNPNEALGVVESGLALSFHGFWLALSPLGSTWTRMLRKSKALFSAWIPM